MLSGLSRCAGVVLVDKQSKTLKQVEFVNLGPGRALAVLVGEDGDVENRIVALPDGLPLSSLTEASNYINARIAGLRSPKPAPASRWRSSSGAPSSTS